MDGCFFSRDYVLWQSAKDIADAFRLDEPIEMSPAEYVEEVLDTQPAGTQSIQILGKDGVWRDLK